MAYHVHSESLSACKSAVLQNISVDIVGRVGSGRSELLKAVSSELRDAGLNVITFSGYPGAAHLSFRALELAGFGSSHRRATAAVLTPAEALAEQVSKRRSVIVVDDAHLLDDDSWTALALVQSQTRTPLVISRVHARSIPASERSGRSLTSSVVTLKLGPLTFEATTELLVDRLGGPAELEVLSRLYRVSGGLPSVLTAVVDVALMSNCLSRIDGVWFASGDFWNENLAGSVRHLLSGLTRSQLDLVEALGMYGALDLDIALDLIGEEELEALEDTEIITIFSMDTRPKVALDPPLIGEWVRHESASLRRRRVAEALHGKVASTEFLAPAKRRRVDSVLSTASSALSSTVADQRATRLRLARDAWKECPSFEAGLALLTEMHASPKDAHEIDAVYAEMREDEAVDPGDRARFRRLRMYWLAYGLDRVGDAIGLAHDLPSALLPYAEYLLAAGLRIEIDADGVPADVEDRLARMRHPAQAVSGWVEVSGAFVYIVQGRPTSALDVLNRLTQPMDGELASMYELVRLWARMGNGEVVWGFEASMKLLNDSLRSLDLTSTRAYALSAATCLQAVGHYAAGESLLGAVLTLGAPAVGQERAHVALLSYAAVFSSLCGHASLAESLVREAERPGLPPSPLPAATAAVARANLQNLSGDRAAAVRSLRDSFDQLMSRGYVLSAVDGALICSALMRVGDLLPEVYRLLPSMQGDWRPQFLGYILAMAQSDLPALESSTEHLIEAGRLASAQYCAAELGRLFLANQDASGVERAGRLTERIVGLRDQIDVAAAGWLYGKHFQVKAGLSSREKEIARLAAKGLSNPAIAEHLTISFRTVEAHLSHVYRKLGVRNRAELLKLNWDWGF